MNKELLGIVSNSTTQCNFVGNTAIAQSLKTFLSTPVRRFSLLRVILNSGIRFEKCRMSERLAQNRSVNEQSAVIPDVTVSAIQYANTDTYPQ
jgi:hypothetical protein